MGEFTIDQSSRPLVRVSYLGGIDDTAFVLHLNEYIELLRRNEPYVVVFDATQASLPSATQRRLQADFMREHEKELERLCLGGAFVIPSPMLRGAMTAILWLQPMPFPYVIVATPPEAEAWAQGKLKQVGVAALQA